MLKKVQYLLHFTLSSSLQNTIVYRANLDALGDIVVAVTFSTGLLVDFKHDRPFFD
jgi:hypothetical protein